MLHNIYICILTWFIPILAGRSGNLDEELAQAKAEVAAGHDDFESLSLVAAELEVRRLTEKSYNKVLREFDTLLDSVSNASDGLKLTERRQAFQASHAYEDVYPNLPENLDKHKLYVAAAEYRANCNAAWRNLDSRLDAANAKAAREWKSVKRDLESKHQVLLRKKDFASALRIEEQINALPREPKVNSDGRPRFGPGIYDMIRAGRVFVGSARDCPEEGSGSFPSLLHTKFKGETPRKKSELTLTVNKIVGREVTFLVEHREDGKTQKLTFTRNFLPNLTEFEPVLRQERRKNFSGEMETFEYFNDKNIKIDSNQGVTQWTVELFGCLEDDAIGAVSHQLQGGLFPRGMVDRYKLILQK